MLKFRLVSPSLTKNSIYTAQCHISYEAREAQASGPLQSRGPQHESQHSLQLQPAFTLWLFPNVQCNIPVSPNSGSWPKGGPRYLPLWVTTS